MSTPYNGKAGNVSAAASVAIASSTNATPIVITTAAAHGRLSGDTVDIYGHQTNTAANGQWIVSVVDATHFSLNASVGNGVGGATGTVDVLAFAASFVQPSDGDAANASSVNAPADGNSDAVTALLVATGAYKLAGLYTNVHDLSALNTSWGSVSVAGGGAFSISSQGFLSIFPNVHVGDVFEIEVNVAAYGGTSSGIYGLALYSNNIPPGAANNFARIPGSGKTWKQANASQALPMTLKGLLTIGPGATATGAMSVAIYGATSGGGADTITMVDDWTIVAKLWRPTFLANQ